MAIKVNKLTIENTKRVKAVSMELASGLNIIGGKNGQGKTSILDAIAWALGGNSFRPSMAQREGSLTAPLLHVELSNGLIVERKGKNSTLKVMDPSGKRYGQQLLDSFISVLALDLPKFMHASDREKADTLLRILGIGDILKQLDGEESTVFNQRTEVGRYRDRKRKTAEELPYFPNVPQEPVSAADLIRQQQAILLKNEENRKKRSELAQMRSRKAVLEDEITHLQKKMDALQVERENLINDITEASKTAAALRDESTEALEKNLADIDTLNQKIRSNAKKEAVELEAENLTQEYDQLTEQIEAIRKRRRDLLASADLPLPGLAVKDGRLLYHNIPWDGMSGADQLKVAVSIVRKLNPECGFVLMDKLEQMDRDTLDSFGAWLDQEGLQVIATRVSTGDECTIIIEDGTVKDQTEAVASMAPSFVKGTF